MTEQNQQQQTTETQADKFTWKENDVQIEQPETEVEMEQEFKLDGRTKRALDAAIAKKQVSQASYKAVVEGRIDLAKAKALGREGSPDTPVGPAKKTISKDEKGQPCWCGCASWTKPNRRFLAGHDQRAKGMITRAVRAGTLDQLSEELQDYAAERDLIRQTQQRMAGEEARKAEREAKKKAAKKGAEEVNDG